MSAIAFEFKALSPDGSVQKGVTQAASESAAFQQIISSGLTPIQIRLSHGRGRLSPGCGVRSIGLRELSVFTYQFSVLIEARIPIAEGLRSIANEESNEKLKSIIEQVAASISAGSSITEALGPFQSVFGEVYLQTIYAAEKSGNLVRVLNHLAEMLDREVEIRSQVRSALLYPISVMSMLVIAVLFLLMVVVPRFEEMFASRGVELPLPTRALLTLSGFTMQMWWIAIPVGAIIYVVSRRIRSSSTASLKVDRLLHRVPVVRSLLQSAALARFAHVFGISLSSGLGLIDCLEMAGRASARPLLLRDASRMAEQVAQGGTLTAVMPACPYLTGFVRRLLSAGEQSADLPGMCQIIARHYDREVRYLAKNVSTLIEPIMVVALASVVLFVALAIFLPMWNMMAVVGG